MDSYYQRNKERMRDRLNQYYHDNQEKIAKQQSASVKRRTQQLRADILKLLGDECVRCGFDDPRALQIDHVNGDGHGHRRKLSYITYYRSALKEIQEGSDRYQLLCANCNWIKRHENNEWGGKNKSPK